MIEDAIVTWKTGENGPVSINVMAPANTPVSDLLSVQFNPFGWTEAIPMWPAGNNRWFYLLYDPLNTMTGASYRYCRNDQCGTADAVETMGPDAAGIPFPPADAGSTIEDNITAWAWMDAEAGPVVVPAIEIKARDANFQSGVALQPAYHPNWQPHLGSAFKNIREIGSNSVILSPTWHLSHQTPPLIELIPGADPFWSDLNQMIVQAQRSGLVVTIHPVLQYSEDPAVWWSTAARDDGWWQSWFDRYRRFILYHADLAAQTGAKAFILGDESILPALPGGILADGSPSGVPGNASEQWATLITDIRTHYTGKLLWFIPLAGEMPAPPQFIESVDQLYVQISPPISSSDQASMPEMEDDLAAILDEKVLALQEDTNQPIILGLLFPSVSGAMDGCAGSSDECISPGTMQQPAYAYPGNELSFKDQANAYSAILSVLNQRSWISGFYASGYYPPVSLKDMSTSVRGKPASDVLWYWYPRLLGQTTP